MSEVNSPTTSRRNLLMAAAAFGAGALSQTTPVTVHAADRINSGGNCSDDRWLRPLRATSLGSLKAGYTTSCS
jgi:hypothetical protein